MEDQRPSKNLKVRRRGPRRHVFVEAQRGTVAGRSAKSLSRKSGSAAVGKSHQNCVEAGGARRDARRVGFQDLPTVSGSPFPLYASPVVLGAI